MEKKKIVTVCLDNPTFYMLENMAETLSKSKSYIVREAISFYFEYKAEIDYQAEQYKRILWKTQLENLLKKKEKENEEKK